MTDIKSKRQTTQQERAADAYLCVTDVKKAAEKVQKEYKSLARGFPAMVQIDGLGAALAFLAAKAGGDATTAHGRLFNHLQAWLEKRKQTSGNLLQSVIGLDSTRYRQVAVEVQAYMVWIKRFVEAEIKVKAED